jgi:hypothetical protein
MWKPWGSKRFCRRRARRGSEPTWNVIGTIRRECLDHLIILNEPSLAGKIKYFLAYCRESRTHPLLAKDAPKPRPVHSADRGAIVAIPQIGGLHHRYERRAA